MTMESGFIKGNSSNLPRVDMIMVATFFATNSNFCAAEFRNVKTSKSSRESYGDDAVGFVQLKRESTLCTVKSLVCPEHKVRAKPYSVTVVVDEKNCMVQSTQCNDCAASAGGCKHAVAFLMWLHRRSEEPSCTEVSCYWQKSKLSKVGTTLKYILASELVKTKDHNNPPVSSIVLTKFIEEGKKRKINNCELLKYQLDYRSEPLEDFSLHQLALKYKEQCSTTFINKIRPLFSDDVLKKIENFTRNQSENNMWHELRYARITASKAYEVSRCKTTDGALVALIMGGIIPETTSMKRGRILEGTVFTLVEKLLGQKLNKCGLFISKDQPIIAGSPDGVCGRDFIIEIKCPISKETFKNYIKDGKASKKCYAQVQIQMYVTGIKKCYFCVAHYDFEKNNEVVMIVIDFDNDYVIELLNSIICFWKANIYPLLYRIA